MKAEKFEISFTHQRKRHQALAYRYSEKDHPHIPDYWVHLPVGKHGKVFTFYINAEPKRKQALVWYPLKAEEDAIAKAIAKVLVKGQGELGV